MEKEDIFYICIHIHTHMRVHTHTHTQQCIQIPHQEKKTLTTINEFIEVAGYKVNTQKSVEFLNTNNEENNSM